MKTRSRRILASNPATRPSENQNKRRSKKIVLKRVAEDWTEHHNPPSLFTASLTCLGQFIHPNRYGLLEVDAELPVDPVERPAAAAFGISASARPDCPELVPAVDKSMEVTKIFRSQTVMLPSVSATKTVETPTAQVETLDVDVLSTVSGESDISSKKRSRGRPKKKQRSGRPKANINKETNVTCNKKNISTEEFTNSIVNSPDTDIISTVSGDSDISSKKRSRGRPQKKQRLGRPKANINKETNVTCNKKNISTEEFTNSIVNSPDIDMLSTVSGESDISSKKRSRGRPKKKQSSGRPKANINKGTNVTCNKKNISNEELTNSIVNSSSMTISEENPCKKRKVEQNVNLSNVVPMQAEFVCSSSMNTESLEDDVKSFVSVVDSTDSISETSDSFYCLSSQKTNSIKMKNVDSKIVTLGDDLHVDVVMPTELPDLVVLPSTTSDVTPAPDALQVNTLQYKPRHPVCIAKGTISQFDIGPGIQCVMCSAASLAAAAVCNRRWFTAEEVDRIVIEGTRLYEDFFTRRPPNDRSYRLLEPEEVPIEFQFNKNPEEFHILLKNNPVWVFNGCYPKTENEVIKQIYDFAEKFNARTQQFNLNEVGFMVTGKGRTSSFYVRDEEVYYFDSHTTIYSNKAALYKFDDLKDLAYLILSHNINSDYAEYSVHMLEIESYQDMNILEDQGSVHLTNPDSISLNLKSEKLNRGRPKKKPRSRRPQSNINNDIQEVEDSQEVSTNEIVDCSTISLSNPPRKKNLGRPSKSKDSLVSHVEAVQKYDGSHPDVHKKAVKRYDQTHTEIHLKAVKKYTDSHLDQVKTIYKNYNKNVRNVEPALRKLNLIAETRDDQLNLIQLFSLKKSTLMRADTYSCGECGAKLFEEEKTRTQWCCGVGRYNILSLPPLEADFYSSNYFKQHSRPYNNMFAFSSLGVSQGFHHPTTGLSFIKILGRVHHKVQGNITAPNNPIGLYICDDEERQRRIQDKNLDVDMFTSIYNYMCDNNPFIHSYKRLYEMESPEAHLVFEKTTRATHGNVLGDMPRNNEIAAVINTEHEQHGRRNIAFWKTGENRFQFVDIMDPLYEPFQYPLLYPHGTLGWHLNAVDNKNNKITQQKYYRCLLLSEYRFWSLGRVSEEWIIDMFCRMEEERLRYVLFAQRRDSSNETRSAPLDEITRQIAEDETIAGEGGAVPGRIYLPNTFTGGPRYMQCKYFDALAIVNRLGRPSYFLTMTCNPQWPEIANNKEGNMVTSAVVTSRVFQLKLQQLIRDLRTGKWFGNIVYLMYVIEFQKRGLPHAHICFRVENAPTQNTEIDKVIRADIPSEEEAGGRLRDIVLTHHVHGPCGPPHRTNLPCWDNEKNRCTKYFPKPVTPVTFTDNKGFVYYKRNPDNTAMKKLGNTFVTVNDLSIVSYNGPLLLKYNCHMNLELSSNRKVVKYLFKYMTKGPDHARVALVDGDVTNEHRDNEIEQYVTKRYVGACDAAWRMMEFNVVSREPNVKQLSVHLENRQKVFFKPGKELDAVERTKSDLLVYFNRPLGDEFENLTYQDFYENYIVHTKHPTTTKTTIYEIDVGNKKIFITKRQRNELVARLFWVQPNRGEQFYLRMLLASIPCRGFEDMLTKGGQTECRTFQEVAKALGLANDEREYEQCLEEASIYFTGKRLRRFFVLLVTNGAPAALLWDKCKDNVCEDYLERFGEENRDQAYNRALIDIDRLLRKHGSCLGEQGLPVVEDHTTELDRELTEYDPSSLRAFVEQWLPLLSTEQKELFDYVNSLLTSTINNSMPSNMQNAIFLDGPSGTGKTLLLKVIVAHVRGSLRRVALCTASSGIAAQNYEGGCTAHSMFRLPFEIIEDNDYWNLTNGTQHAELIRESSLIIYDEAPMAHKYLIHVLDRSLRDLMKSQKLFGGKVVILSGDFRQIPPVVPTARNHNDIVQASLRTSPLWPNLKKFSLTQAQRTRTDAEYSDFLLKLGSGLCEMVPFGENRHKRTLLNIGNINVVTELDQLLDFVFPDDVLNDSDECAKRAILSTHNVNVREINARILEKIEGDLQHCYSVDSVEAGHENEFHLEQDTLNKIQAAGVPDHDLILKKNSVCMIIRNLSFPDGLVNGTKVIVTNISSRLITVRKPGENETYLIPRIDFKFPVEPKSPIDMTRKQFPLQICYAMTVHKSQGQTIDRVGVDLRSDCFSHGQLYVALGRVRDRANIMVLLTEDRIFDNVPYTGNIIINELIN